MRKPIVFLLFSVVLSCGVHAQNLIGDLVTFDGTAFTNWTQNGDVTIVADGRATGTPFFGGRDSILSTSGGRALLLEGGDPASEFESPLTDFSAQTEVWLGFHQYYRRNDDGFTEIVIRNDGLEVARLPINDLLPPGAETGRADTVLLDLTPWLAGFINRSVSLTHSGGSYFWLVDDIGLYDGPPLPRTRPTTLGDHLADVEYPFAVDSAGGAYIPFQLVVQFDPLATPAARDTIRRELGARLVDACACNLIELWEIDGSLIQAQNGQQEPATGTTDVLSNIKRAKARTEIDEAERNYYNLTEPVAVNQTPAQPLTNADWIGYNLPTAANSALRIAILDTGIDYLHPTIRPFIAAGANDRGGLPTDGDNCLTDDRIGWNFVDDNNNPYDNHGHGTHVAGILADSLARRGGTGCDYEIRAYKTHDGNGVSTLYDVTCATYQATLDDVDIINDSWGFFGDSSLILANAIDTAASLGMLVISAAGNDRIDLDTLRQYPACYAAENLITVAATFNERDPNGQPQRFLASFSNYSPSFVDVAAPGVDIFSTAPGTTTYVPKSGTSMATPMVSAAAAIAYACARESTTGIPDPAVVKNGIIASFITDVRLDTVSAGGAYLAYGPPCVCDPTGLVMSPNADVAFRAYPNPVGRRLSLEARGFRGRADLTVLDAVGRTVFHLPGLRWAENETRTVSLPTLRPGWYVLRLRGDRLLWTTPLLRY